MSTATRSDRLSEPATTPQVDPRGQRFAAIATTVLLAVALVAEPSALTVSLLAVQGVLFAAATLLGVTRTPYAWVFRTVVRPRIGAPAETEDASPPRFAQGVGLAFTVIALAGFLLGVDLLGAVATGFALAAAFLNAAFGFCLGCEVYLLGRRLTAARTTA